VQKSGVFCHAKLSKCKVLEADSLCCQLQITVDSHHCNADKNTLEQDASHHFDVERKIKSQLPIDDLLSVGCQVILV
jgi:hypothetical protein